MSAGELSPKSQSHVVAPVELSVNDIKGSSMVVVGGVAVKEAVIENILLTAVVAVAVHPFESATTTE